LQYFFFLLLLLLLFLHLVYVSKSFFIQFSLPQTSLEIETVEKLLHVPEDSVPCKIRAKRGFATHPRSIAERVSKVINFLGEEL
jgi:hypothetical protein